VRPIPALRGREKNKKMCAKLANLNEWYMGIYCTSLKFFKIKNVEILIEAYIMQWEH
jgi:hypothetical protein